MISMVLQHLESLQLNLSAIDPAHRTDAAYKVAAMASELRQAVANDPSLDKELIDEETDSSFPRHH